MINIPGFDKLVEDYPKIIYKIKVTSMFSEDYIDGITGYNNGYGYISKTLFDFINSITPETILVFEYPMWFETSDYSGRLITSFRITVTNLNTKKTILVPPRDLQFIYRCCKEFYEER